MATRTVRLDAEAERILAEVQSATDLSVSDVLKRGLLAVRDRLQEETVASPYDFYAELDLGPAKPKRNAPRAERAKEIVREAIRRKHRR